MATFRDQITALSFRDWVKSVIASEVERLRPRARYGVVQSVDTTTRHVSVLQNGEPPGAEVSLPYGSAVPTVGSTVRIEGTSTDRYVADVVG